MFYPNTRKKSKKNGKIPFYIRILAHDQKAEARLAVQLTDLQFNLWNPLSLRLDERNIFSKDS